MQAEFLTVHNQLMSYDSPANATALAVWKYNWIYANIILFHTYIQLCLQDYLCDDSGEPGGDASEGISKLLELLILGHEVKSNLHT